MTNLILAVIFIGLALIFIDLKKIYHYVPKTELKKRSINGDKQAELIFKVVAYGTTLNIFLWALITIFSALGILFITKFSPNWLAVILIIFYLFIAFIYLPNSKIKKFSYKLIPLLNPILLSSLNIIENLLDYSGLKSKIHDKSPNHTKIYDKKDLEDLLGDLKDNKESRINEDELLIIKNSIALTEEQVSEVMKKYSLVHGVSDKDSISPVIMDEIYKSKQQFIPVLNDEQVIIGMIDLNRLSISSKGSIQDHMNSELYYLNENDNLAYALNAFKTTNSPVFIVVDQSENYSGILTFNDLVNKLIGHIPGNPIDEFTSLSSAARKYLN